MGEGRREAKAMIDDPNLRAKDYAAWLNGRPDTEALRNQYEAMVASTRPRLMAKQMQERVSEYEAGELEEINKMIGSGKFSDKAGQTEAMLRGAKMMGANSMVSLLGGKSANKPTTTVQSVRTQVPAKKQWSLFG